MIADKLTTVLTVSSFFVTLIQVFGVFRILRILRVFKHFKSLLKTEIFVQTLKASVGELVCVVGLFTIGILVSANICYLLEVSSEASHFLNIPEACYWAVITLTTVGYGDMRPITPLGKVFVCFSALYGLIMISFLVSVLIKNFTECSSQAKGLRKCLNTAYEYSIVGESQPLTAPGEPNQDV